MGRKIIAIMQPTYMPWMGYFSMIDRVDEFVFLDMVQLVGRSWQVRNKIKLDGTEKLLTIPVKKDKAREERVIRECPYLGEEWKRSHLDTIKAAYKKAPFFAQVFPFLSALYEVQAESVGAFNSMLIQAVAQKIGIVTPFVSAFQVMGQAEEKKDSLLAAICEKRGAACYLSAPGSAAYIEKDCPGGAFAKSGIELYYHHYIHPQYRQEGNAFLSHIGIYDLLFNEGFERALPIIRSGNKSETGRTCVSCESTDF